MIYMKTRLATSQPLPSHSLSKARDEKPSLSLSVFPTAKLTIELKYYWKGRLESLHEYKNSVLAKP